jgi:predicted nucleic acid-binding Zn ribbon protein
MPGALETLLREVPLSTGKVIFAWKSAVGPAIDRACSVRLEGTTLLVDVPDPEWARQVRRMSSIILSRLQALLGNDVVASIDVRR